MSTSAEAYHRWRTHGGLFDLSGRTKLRLTGADRVRYLNGQVTANVMGLAKDGTLAACVTTAKGKLSADVVISGDADALFVDAEAELREPLLARLERYVVADDVVIEDVTDGHGLVHVIGSRAGELAAGIPFSGGAVRKARRYGATGWDLLLPRPESDKALKWLMQESGAQLIDADLAETIRIEAGVPRWGMDFGEETLPPEAGLDLTHIDYAKGCYIGQEVISRLKSVGHVNKQLRGFEGAGDETLQSGWQIFSAEDPAKAVGHLTSATWSFALAKPIALGYLKRGAPSAKLFARPAETAAPGIEVSAHDLPFVPHPFSA